MFASFYFRDFRCAIKFIEWDLSTFFMKATPIGYPCSHRSSCTQAHTDMGGETIRGLGVELHGKEWMADLAYYIHV